MASAQTHVFDKSPIASKMTYFGRASKSLFPLYSQPLSANFGIANRERANNSYVNENHHSGLLMRSRPKCISTAWMLQRIYLSGLNTIVLFE
ncbi:hypothetical protein [Dictyobacter formicarum]|uniref:hypothetical protein n=1 Tax=Dictyobacter formicarum TaxID=2778368 RepID=UPI001915DE9A|nr:hypothetical protein [Dictyobacter formicarum]